MSDLAVSAKGVGKQYVLGQRESGYTLLSEVVIERLRRLGRPQSRRESFWALQDIDFEVQRGETFGIVGHNGAGKTTLLKILARITPPTEGEVRLRGRVGALLEVGTGFHPELSGRENIYLNGAILGMRAREIGRKFDEIVEFAGVERFMDTPVKRYSTGMYLRLAFSVAAHLEPEILVVDEVLSVGDLAFQEKCLGRMETVAGEGRTVLFVSHNLPAVAKLCPHSMLLAHGRHVMTGPTKDVVAEYVQTVRHDASTSLAERRDRSGSGRLRFEEIYFEVPGDPHGPATTGQDMDIVLRYSTADGRPLRGANFAVVVYSMLGEVMVHLYNVTRGTTLGECPPEGQVRCRVPRCPLPAGRYSVNVWADASGEPLDWVQRAAELTVSPGDFFDSGRSQPESHQSVIVDHSWSVEDVQATDDRSGLTRSAPEQAPAFTPKSS